MSPENLTPLESFNRKRDLLLEEWEQVHGDKSNWSYNLTDRFVDAVLSSVTYEEGLAHKRDTDQWLRTKALAVNKYNQYHRN
ncbi:MAG TPA: hypothetical protein VI819_04500 [Patescibacteria group bacterium]|nr:hypothetical protein [Patescibacteria group bacterium]